TLSGLSKSDYATPQQLPWAMTMELPQLSGGGIKNLPGLDQELLAQIQTANLPQKKEASRVEKKRLEEKKSEGIKKEGKSDATKQKRPVKQSMGAFFVQEELPAQSEDFAEELFSRSENEQRGELIGEEASTRTFRLQSDEEELSAFLGERSGKERWLWFTSFCFMISLLWLFWPRLEQILHDRTFEESSGYFEAEVFLQLNVERARFIRLDTQEILCDETDSCLIPVAAPIQVESPGSKSLMIRQDVLERARGRVMRLQLSPDRSQSP
ncbi:MAG: hypothetical protein VYD19_09070, partial [Myxococcota bacterium]|nr:hypothetical protein [Myxococcota bacterium]